jgi:hypothetical protein
VDRFLQAWLETRAPRDSTAGTSRAAVEALDEELFWLASLTATELSAKLADVEADVHDLREEAEWLRQRVTEAHRALEKLKLVAARRAHEVDATAAGAAPGPRRKEDEDTRPLNGRSETAREAVLALLREDPTRSWTPQLAYDELRRRGLSVARTAVQTALQRMAIDERLVRRLRPGTYQAGPGPTAAHSPESTNDLERRAASAALENGHVDKRWLTPDLLDRLAGEARIRFALKHAGVADGDFLVAEAKRRVAVWVEGHGRDPDDEAHVKRLMKTGLHDHYRRSANGSRSTTTAEEREEDSASGQRSRAHKAN